MHITFFFVDRLGEVSFANHSLGGGGRLLHVAWEMTGGGGGVNHLAPLGLQVLPQWNSEHCNVFDSFRLLGCYAKFHRCFHYHLVVPLLGTCPCATCHDENI